MMELFVVISSMAYGECTTVEGVFSTEVLAETFIAEQEKRSDLYYYAYPAKLDDPRF